MPTTSKCISSAETSPLNSVRPIAYLTFPPGWVTNPKLNSWSSPIPTQDALLRSFVFSANANIIFLLAQAKRPVILDSSFLSHTLYPIYIDLYWNHIGSICKIHPEFISPSLHFIQILAFIPFAWIIAIVFKPFLLSSLPYSFYSARNKSKPSKAKDRSYYFSAQIILVKPHPSVKVTCND